MEAASVIDVQFVNTDARARYFHCGKSNLAWRELVLRVLQILHRDLIPNAAYQGDIKGVFSLKISEAFLL